ncbi:helix-turn-helix domain-containing protein [Zongyangia hominis]|nr:helix-turn-helix transcriptional regulator [Zongyangia hominis]
MKELSIGNKISMRRKTMGLTQEELASYLGVSKPAVSKWESGQSYPDITLLPVLAAYFNCSVDDLLGYEPQLPKERIRQIYLRFCEEVSPATFPQLHAECGELCKKYYSCWQLLFTMGQWLLNHANLAPPNEAPKIMEEALHLFARVGSAGEDPVLARQAIIMRACCHLGLGQPLETIELLDGMEESPRCPEVVLAQAHQMRGDEEKAQEILQVSLYNCLVELYNIFPNLAYLYVGNPEKLKACVQRANAVSAAFSFGELHPILQISFAYSAATAYAMSGLKEEALTMLEEYAHLILSQKTYPLQLKGDAFFDKLDRYFSSLELGTALPRSEDAILESFKGALEGNPAFVSLTEEPRFQAVCRGLAHLSVSPSPKASPLH